MKFKLNENLYGKKLTEAFSKTMPGWLRLALESEIKNTVGSRHRADVYGSGMKGNSSNNRTISRGVDNFDNKNYRIAPRARTKGDSPTFRNLFGGFDALNIDLSKAKFIEVPVPTSIKDPHLRDPYIPVFKLQSEDHYGNLRADYQVYAAGVNDYAEDWYLGKAFKYETNKQLLEKTTAFCYLDKSDPDNYKTEMQSDEYRDTLEKERKESGNERLTPKEAERLQKQIDKSGYVVDPNKYKNKLIESGRYDLYKDLEKAYADVVAIRNGFSNYVRYSSDFATSSYQYNDFFMALVGLSEGYNIVLGDVDSAYRRGLDNDSIKRIDRNIKSLKDRIEDTKNRFSDFIYSEVDWDDE